MAKTKRRVDPNVVDPVSAHVADLGRFARPVQRVIIPTDDHRHMSHIRDGRFNPIVFKRDQSGNLNIPVETTVLGLTGSPSEGGQEVDNASEKPKATKVGVRRKRRRVGEEAPLQPAEKKESKPQAPKVRKHKKGQRRGD